MTLWSVVVIHFTTVVPGAKRLCSTRSAVRNIAESEVMLLIVSCPLS